MTNTAHSMAFARAPMTALAASQARLTDLDAQIEAVAPGLDQSPEPDDADHVRARASEARAAEIAAVTTSPALAGAIRAVLNHAPAWHRAWSAHTASEEAIYAVPENVIPIPAQLILPGEPSDVVKMTMKAERADGIVSEHVIDHQPSRRTLTTKAEVLAHCGDDADRAAELIAVLEKHKRAVRNAPRAKARKVEAKADAVWTAAHEERRELIEAILDVPATSPTVSIQKLDAFAVLISEGGSLEDHDTAAALDAARADLFRLAGIHDDGRAAWNAALAACEIAQGDAVDDEDDAVLDALCDAERALIETPAPDLAAVALKTAMLARELDDERRGFDDPVHFAVARDISFVAMAWAAHIYSDIYRLSGQPIPAFIDFEPRKWKRAFEAAGGSIIFAEDRGSFEIFHPAPPEGDVTTTGALQAHLAEGRNGEVFLRYLQEAY
ncbi:MAG TPA: hypothetical protein VN018_07850 [Brevundimonas sp.]|nr:hypothetical protein [Brevundimonas sp.]